MMFRVFPFLLDDLDKVEFDEKFDISELVDLIGIICMMIEDGNLENRNLLGYLVENFEAVFEMERIECGRRIFSFVYLIKSIEFGSVLVDQVHLKP